MPVTAERRLGCSDSHGLLLAARAGRALANLVIVVALVSRNPDGARSAAPCAAFGRLGRRRHDVCRASLRGFATSGHEDAAQLGGRIMLNRCLIVVGTGLALAVSVATA